MRNLLATLILILTTGDVMANNSDPKALARTLRGLSNPLDGPVTEMNDYSNYYGRTIQALPRDEQQAAWGRFNEQFAPLMDARDGSLNYAPRDDILPPVPYQPRTVPSPKRLRIPQDRNS